MLEVGDHMGMEHGGDVLKVVGKIGDRFIT
jgi:hypothetical protein